jgi:hypothetical protein
MERSLRKSAGIDIYRFIPFLFPFGVLITIGAMTDTAPHCGGHCITGSSKAAALAHLVIGIVHSPQYLFDPWHHWIAAPLFWIGLALSLYQFHWIRKHEQYWAQVREKRRQKKLTPTQASEPPLFNADATQLINPPDQRAP